MRASNTPPVWTAELDDILHFIHDSYTIGCLSLRFTFKKLAGSRRMTEILKEFCRRVSKVVLGTVSVLLEADYFDEKDLSDTWFTISGPDLSAGVEKMWTERDVED
jgi:hypothetical protein